MRIVRIAILHMFGKLSLINVSLSILNLLNDTWREAKTNFAYLNFLK